LFLTSLSKIILLNKLEELQLFKRANFSQSRKLQYFENINDYGYIRYEGEGLPFYTGLYK